MRIIAIATVCALTAALPAHAQQVETIKARGANAAGACAGSLDLLGQFLSRATNPDAGKLAEVQLGRDFFADLPRFPKADITAAAEAFIKLMVERLQKAQTIEEQRSIQREIVSVSNGCLVSAKVELAKMRAASPPAIVPAQPGIIQPAPSYETVPLQPYTTQPLTLDPVPAQ